MSVQNFIADPLAYTKGHVVQFSHNGAHVSPAASGMQVQATMNHWGGNWTAEEYGMTPGQFTNFTFFGDTDAATGAHVRIGKGASAMHTLCCHTVGADLGIRFLPWNPNTVTYMTLDAGAQTFFTGPLSGCSIFVGQAGGQWTIFHANRNNAGGVGNSAMKASMTTDVITRLPAPIPIQHSAIYQRDYHDLGFVFGQIKGGQWKFYVADTRATGGGQFATRVKKLH